MGLAVFRVGVTVRGLLAAFAAVVVVGAVAGPVLRMSLDVFGQVVGAHEPLVADGAREPLLARVCPEVCLEV